MIGSRLRIWATAIAGKRAIAMAGGSLLALLASARAAEALVPGLKRGRSKGNRDETDRDRKKDRDDDRDRDERGRGRDDHDRHEHDRGRNRTDRREEDNGRDDESERRRAGDGSQPRGDDMSGGDNVQAHRTIAANPPPADGVSKAPHQTAFVS